MTQSDSAYGLPDMTMLNHIHEAAILENLNLRSTASEPKAYTYMGRCGGASELF